MIETAMVQENAEHEGGLSPSDARGRRLARLRAIVHKSPARLLSIEHAAELLDTSARTVERLLSEGELRRVRVSPQIVRIRADDLAAFIDRRTEEDRA